jgi:hypothetical protein
MDARPLCLVATLKSWPVCYLVLSNRLKHGEGVAMKKVLLGTIALAALMAAPATAADLARPVPVYVPPPPVVVAVFSWSGIYIGINAGEE